MPDLLNDLHVRGTLTADKFTPPASSIGNDAIKSGDYLSGLKIQHGVRQTLAQDSDSTATAQTRTIHVAIGSGTVMNVEAGCVVACTGNAAVTVDIQKNGTTILSSTINLSSAQSAREVVAATISTEDYVADDIFEAVITVDAGTGTLGKGVFVNLVTRENPQ